MFAFLHGGRTLPPLQGCVFVVGVGEICLKKGLHKGIASPIAYANSWGGAPAWGEVRIEGQAVWECPFSLLPSACLGLMGFTGLRVCMLRPLTLGIQASGNSKAPVEHWEMFWLLLSLEVGTPFCSGAEIMPWPSPSLPCSCHSTQVSNREHVDLGARDCSSHSASSSVLPLRHRSDI